MVLTHLWVCGRWVWRFLTFAQWQAMPHVGRHLAMVKAAKIGGALVCAGTIGLVIPPMLDRGPPSAPGLGGTGTPAVDVPEPWSAALLGVGVAGLVVIGRRR